MPITLLTATPTITAETVTTEPFLEKLGLRGKRLILTFGLIAPSKGIENMIAAMPSIVALHPDAHYLIVGATHPHVRKHSSEVYRQSLIDLAANLGVSDNVGFVDRFVSIDELTDFLQASSIYVTPYLTKEQITSGTLAYAFGSGKAVVSTPYWHAEELLAEGRGILVPFRNPEALAREIGALLGDPDRLESVQSRSFEAGLKMVWPVIGREYVDVFEEALGASRIMLRGLPASKTSEGALESFENELMLNHLLVLTDDTGILQHANYTVPNRYEGYCTDDNARLAIVGVKLESEPNHAGLGVWLQHKALSFMQHAWNPENGRMRNFMGYDRVWLEQVGSEDSHGRALWALGVLTDESSIPGVRAVAKGLFLKGLPGVEQFTSPRAIAFALLGLDKVLASSYCVECFRMVEILGKFLSDLHKKTADSSWPWYENGLAYDNARLPQAMLAAGCMLGDDDMIANAKASLRWLIEVQTDPDGNFLPIGSNGFYSKGGARATHDQQPLEAAATVDACFDVYQLTGDAFWQHEARRAFDWFHGGNTERKCLIDASTGGCKDGLEEGGLNHNQGAESTLAFIASSLALTQFELVSMTRQRGFLG